MAATTLIALHVNKGKTVAKCLADRTDFSENEAMMKSEEQAKAESREKQEKEK